jgi:hypothetical protein
VTARFQSVYISSRFPLSRLGFHVRSSAQLARIYRPAFALQQHRQSPVSIAHPGTGQLSYPHPQLHLRITPALVAIDPASDPDQPARSVFAQLVTFPYRGNELAASGGLQTFFESTSCNMCLSRVRSATNVFSLRFSSRNCRSSRRSLNPNPAYRRRQL